MTNRRDFLKTTTAAAIATIPILNSCAPKIENNEEAGPETDQDHFL